MKTIFLMGLLLVTHFLFAHADKNKNSSQITITGLIPDSAVQSGTQPEIWYYNNYNDQQMYTDAEITSVNSRSAFSVSINMKNDIAYIRFANLIHLPATLYQDVFLVNSGDSICLHITPKKDVYFTGRGASKLNYQINISRRIAEISSLPFISDDFAEINAHATRLEEERLKMATDSLKSHQAEWDDRTYNLLRFYTLSVISETHFDEIGNFAVYVESKDSTFKKLEKIKIHSLAIEQSAFAVSDPVLVRNPFVYLHYLYALFSTDEHILTGQRHVPFGLIYETINQRFTGLLRDKFLAYAFQRNAGYPGVYDLLSKASSIMRDSVSKTALQQMLVKSPGAQLYDFKLTGINGNIISAPDYKGKALIMDFWFNGCENCIGVAKSLKPIIEHYKNNKNVVFLCVNVDKSKKRFIDGVNSGLYGSPGEVYVYTSGLGNFDPILLYYNYTAFPNLIVVDRDSKIISCSPPRGSESDYYQVWLSLIDRAVQTDKEHD